MTISGLALGVSFLSLILTYWRSHTQSQMNFETIRGNIQSQMTACGVLLLMYCDQLCTVASDNSDAMELLAKLTQLGTEWVKLRAKIQKMTAPPIFTSTSTKMLQRIQSDFADTQIIWDDLDRKMSSKDYIGAIKNVKGLLERVTGRTT